MQELKRYYISLCRGLIGYYVAVDATDMEVVRMHAAKYFGNIWCSVYTSPYSSNGVKFTIINEDNPIVLGDCPDWE